MTVLLVLTTLLGVVCFYNFDKGLKRFCKFRIPCLGVFLILTLVWIVRTMDGPLDDRDEFTPGILGPRAFRSLRCLMQTTFESSELPGPGPDWVSPPCGCWFVIPKRHLRSTILSTFVYQLTLGAGGLVELKGS